MSSESDNAVHGAHREEAGTLTQHQLDGSLGFHEGHGSMGISGVRINEPKAVDLEKITEGLQKTSLQRQRLHNFDYQAYSLPVSRNHSREHPPPPTSPRASTSKPAATPPLTPASTHDRVPKKTHSQEQRNAVYQNPPKLSSVDPATMTPQTSPPRSTPTTAAPKTPLSDRGASPNSSRPSSSHSSAHNSSRNPTFVIGPSDSGDPSPVGTPSLPSSPFLPPSRPFTPAADEDDPYSRHKRPTPSKNLEDIEARFKFNSKRHHQSATSLTSHLNGHDHKKGHSHLSLSTLGMGDNSKKGSMDNLKRFFKSSSKSAKKRTQSPAGSGNSVRSSATTHTPFGEDFGLTKKYGKFGKVLGSGAGGSVRLMKRSSDNITFAVKEFRPRHSYETEREYAKKVTAEFCIGSTLHHGNIVETLDIVHERGRWYEVMEYCPYDLFATVMTGKMGREEVACAFMQIVNGVTFLHSMGLAHRDLKLDNVVINQYGILKIIDFGSASVFRYPFENGIVEAHGIVGSDPYLSPEVCNDLKYDPQPADIWSLAIIFCCMSLRRFPWKAPRMSDNSFKLFCQEPDAASLAACQSPPQPAPGMNAVIPTSQIKGPQRLMRLLPRECRHIVGRMLTLDPKKRATLGEIWEDEWVKSIAFCRQEPGHNVIKADNHEHTLETQTNQAATSNGNTDGPGSKPNSKK